MSTRVTREYALHEAYKRRIGYDNCVTVYYASGSQEPLPAFWTLTLKRGQALAVRRAKRRTSGPLVGGGVMEAP